MAAASFTAADPGSAEARWAMGEYFDELARRFPGGFDPGDALDEAADRYLPPTGLFVLAREADRVVACGALDLLDETRAEIKRMWVSPRRRGAGLGRRLLEHLEGEARRAGRMTVVLDTNGSLPEALALYGGAGYVPTSRYSDNPYAEHWFTKALPTPT